MTDTETQNQIFDETIIKEEIITIDDDDDVEDAKPLDIAENHVNSGSVSPFRSNDCGEQINLHPSTPIRQYDDESSRDSSILQIVDPAPGAKKRSFSEISIDKEIEEDIQRELENKAKKTSLTVKNVKSILRYVIGNESVLTMVRNAMRDSGEGADLGFEPKLTRSKARKLREEKQILWPLSPILPPQPDNNEHLVLIQEELPEEEDDDEYHPSQDDLQEHSDDETGRQSVASSCNVSTSCIFDSFEAQSVNDSASFDFVPEEKPPEAMPDDLSKFKRPLENIGQRTRSKLSLSSTPLEAIEQAFVPPDITTDMYDFKCDNQEWENFLKEFMQPLSNDATDVDEDDDPEYNILAEEEVVDQEELRHDKGVTVSRAELRTLMMELFQIPEEQSSDEEVVKEQPIESEAVEESPDEYITQVLPPPPPEVIGVTSSQQLLLQQQLRQHVQLIVQHFIQTHNHPLFSDVAAKCKVMLAQFVELGRINEKSVINVYNLKRGFDLVEEWEKLMLTKKGNIVSEHVNSGIKLAQIAKANRGMHKISFHPIMTNFIMESDVFLYPLMLPVQPFRCDNPSRLEYTSPEDQLIALGLEQFIPHIEKYPRWSDSNVGADRAAADLIHELLVPGKTTMQIVRRIRAARYIKENPIWYYRTYGKAPKTMHFVIPFNSSLIKTPREQCSQLLPEAWRSDR